MYGGAKGRRPPGLRERRHSGLRPGIAGADTLCQPLARLRAGAGMPPFHTYFAGREACVPYQAEGSLAGFQQRHLAAGTVEYGAECA